MTQSPPIPLGNQSPYPLTEPPHAHPPEPAPQVRRDVPTTALAIAPALAVGTVAVAAFGIAAFVFGRRKAEPAPQPARRQPRKTTKASVRRKAAMPKPAKAPAKRTRQSSTDDRSKRGPQDASRIAMSEDYEVRYWTKKFGVDRDELQRAVDTVGNAAAAVKQELQKS